MILTLPRRRFLKTSILAGAALTAPRSFAQNSKIAPASKKQKVAVVGAGIAGLVAAHELVQSGHDVIVFEARTRPGGRILTLRDDFADGLHAEAGALDFGDAYTSLQHYIKLFNLPFSATGATQKTASPKDAYFLDGKRYLVTSGKDPDWPFPMSSEDRQLGIPGLWNKYVIPAAQDIPDPSSPGWPDARSRAFDSMTIEESLRAHNTPSGVIAALKMDFLGDDYDHVSGLQDVFWHRFFDGNNKWMQLRDGNDQLPKAFAAKLGERIHYGTALLKIAQDQHKVHLTMSRGNSREQVEADQVVIAIPFSCLRQVELDDSFSAGKRSAISRMRYESAVHIHLQTRSRFWQQQGLSGFANTDLPIRNILHDTEGQPGTRGIVGIETAGHNALIASKMSPEDRLTWGVENAEKVLPGMAENYEGGVSLDWGQEQWSLGCSAYFAPGEMTEMFPHVGNPEGRVHFAGEHTSTVYVMEGAAQSGIRTVQEINATV